jgi:hypothetical protein
MGLPGPPGSPIDNPNRLRPASGGRAEIGTVYIELAGER